MSLRARLALAFALASLALIAAIAVTVYVLSLSAAREQSATRLNHMAIGLRDRLDTGMYERQQDMRILADLEATRALKEGPAALRKELERRKLGYPEFSWIGFADSNGRVVAATGGLLENADVSQRPWWIEASRGAEFLGDVHEAVLLQNVLAPGAREPLRFVDIAFPVMENGALIGVVGAHVGWEWAGGLAAHVLQASSATGQVDLIVTNSAGKVLLGPRDLEGVTLPPTIGGTPRADGFMRGRWTDGRDYVAASSLSRGERTYKGLGWRVIARQSSDSAFAKVENLRRVLMVAALCGVFLVSLLGYFLARGLARPLEQWAATADRIGKGDRDVTFPEIPDSSELGRLSAALRSMAIQLGAKEDMLQARIDERTAELRNAMDTLEGERERLALALDGSRLAMWDLDLEHGTVTLSAEWARMLGDPPGETRTTAVELLERVPEEEHVLIHDATTRLLGGESDQYDVEHRVRRADGAWLWIRSRGQVMRRSADGKALRVNGTNADITLRKEQEQRLREQAFTDSVTGLPNRRLMIDRVQVAIARARRANEQFALVYLDLDGFKPVNDRLGHEAGDELLRRVGERLGSCVRESDTVARVGGDEYAVLLDPLRSPQDADLVVAKIRAVLAARFELAGAEAAIGASIGIAIYPRDGREVVELLRTADAAMYRDKAAPRTVR